MAKVTLNGFSGYVWPRHRSSILLPPLSINLDIPCTLHVKHLLLEIHLKLIHISSSLQIILHVAISGLPGLAEKLHSTLEDPAQRRASSSCSCFIPDDNKVQVITLLFKVIITWQGTMAH